MENIDDGALQGNANQVDAHLEVRDTYFDNAGGYRASEVANPEGEVTQCALPAAY